MSDSAALTYEIRVPVKSGLLLSTLPFRIQSKLWMLVEDLRRQGPEPRGWPTLTRLSGSHYRCHLEGRWVTGWGVRGQVIEVLPPGAPVSPFPAKGRE